MKKTLSLCLALIMLLSSLTALPVGAFAAQTTGSFIPSPLYSGTAEMPALGASLTEASPAASYNGSVYYGEGRDFYGQLRDNFAARNTAFSLRFLTPNRIGNISTSLNDWFMAATDNALSQSCTDGDYIRWAVSGLKVSTMVDQTAGGNYYYTLDFTIRYYDSAAEEAQVDSVVQQFLATVSPNTMSDYQMATAAHDFICARTTYDNEAYSHLNSAQSYGYAFTSYGALITGKSVCQGYAVAFYRLCKEVGLDVRFVSSSPSQGRHAWNILKLDNRYYFVDCTWDDTAMESGKNPYQYFLISYDNMRADDTKYQEHLLNPDYYSDEAFTSTYTNAFAPANYDATNVNLMSQQVVYLPQDTFVCTGAAVEPSVIVASGLPYTVQYADNITPGKGYAVIWGADGSATQRRFFLLPAAMTGLSLASGGRSTKSLKLKWNAAAGVDGYEIEQLKSGAWQCVADLGAAVTTQTIASLSPAAKQQFRIRSYKTIDRVKRYGDYSAVFADCTKPLKVTLSKLTTKAKSITVNWKKASCSGYEIQYATNKSMKKAKTVKVSAKKLNKKLTKLKKGKTYYIRVRAYKTYTPAGGKAKTYYGAWSSKKSVKCK